MIFRSTLMPATKFLLVLAGYSTPVRASEVFVQVGDIKSDTGEVGCALFSSAKGFPIERSGVKLE